MWDVQKAVQHLNEHAEAASKGYCAGMLKPQSALVET